MIVFRYNKIDGAEYLSHLDVLRHIDRTLRRAQIPILYSGGYHPHPRIFLNNPLGTGIKSVAEYGAIETNWTGDFKAIFNNHAPKGLQCVEWDYCEKNPNFAYEITSCRYRLAGVAPFDVNEILEQPTIEITDSRGRLIDMRSRIYELYQQNGYVYARLGCGTENLRPDLLLAYLCERYGGKAGEILKTEVFPAYPLLKK
jgi:radical SAM-linked protein